MKKRIKALRLKLFGRIGYLQRKMKTRLKADTGINYSIRFVDVAEQDPFRFTIRRDGSTVTIPAPFDRVNNDENVIEHFFDRVYSCLRVVLQPAVRINRFVVDLHDKASEPSFTLCVASTSADAIMIPDAEFLANEGYESARARASELPAWRNRRSTVLWRGSTTGAGAITSSDMAAHNPALTQRTRFCLAARDIPDVDIKFSRIVQSADADTDGDRLDRAGIFGERLSQFVWMNHRFAGNIDGNSSAFSNPFIRSLLGCCVLNVRSEIGYFQWYHHELVAWKHYVPVAADLSDLGEIIAWCRSHDDECQAIAQAGHVLAMERTVARELARTAEILNRRLTSQPE